MDYNDIWLKLYNIVSKIKRKTDFLNIDVRCYITDILDDVIETYDNELEEN